MFAKVFGQIFDSSIAEDYNCRRMFIDLLVLADSDGAVDMTAEAISRRTNVPLEEVLKYIKELCQPDPSSRSKLHEGKRIIPLDSQREWGWQIVNYGHYREIRDEAARRVYFRDKQRARRKKLKAVKDKVLTTVDISGQVLTPASASTSSSSFLDELRKNPLYAEVEFDRELEKAKQWCKRNNRRLTERFFTNWLNKADRVLIAKPSKPNYLPPRNELTDEQIAKNKEIVAREKAALAEKLKMP